MSDADAGGPLELEAADGVLVLTINRPKARNSVDKATSEAIAAAVDRLDEDDDLRVGILTGAGGFFSAGMDLKAFARGEVPFVEGRGFAGLAERGPRKPLIAAVEGPALAGGCELALACDLVVAAEGATFGIPEVKRSLVAAGGALVRLPRRIPYHVAMELALTGDPIGAARAAELGLVNRVTGDGGALDGARELAGRIVGNAPLALIASKELVRLQTELPETEAFAKQGEVAGPVFTSEDAQEGARAFAEKRPPVWKGR